MSFRRVELKEMAINAVNLIAELPGLDQADLDMLIAIGTHALKRATELQPSVGQRPLAARPVNPPSRL